MAEPWELAVGPTPVARTVKVAQDAAELHRAHRASMHSVDVDHLREIGASTLHLESQGHKLTKTKSSTRHKKRIEHSFEPPPTEHDGALHKSELDQILMAEEWDTRFWNTVKIYEAIQTLYIEVERGVDPRRRDLAIQMLLHLNKLHPEAYAYNDNNLPMLTNKAFTKLSATTNATHIFNMAELVAIFTGAYPIELANENAVLRALHCVLRRMDCAARVLQHARRRLVFERSLRRREISLEARLRARAVNLAKTMDLQRQQKEIRAAHHGASLPPRAQLAYMRIVWALVQYEFDHRNDAGRQDFRKLHHTGAIVWLVQCVRQRTDRELELMALRLFTILAHDKDRIGDVLLSNIVGYIADNLIATDLRGVGSDTTTTASLAFLDAACKSMSAMVLQLTRPRGVEKKASRLRSTRRSVLTTASATTSNSNSTSNGTSVDDEDAAFLNRALPAIIAERVVAPRTFQSLLRLVGHPALTLPALEVLHKMAHASIGYLALVDVVTRNAGRYLEAIVGCLTSEELAIGLASLQLLFALGATDEGRDALTTAGLVLLVTPLCGPGFRRSGNSYRFVLGLLVITSLASPSPLSFGPSADSLEMVLALPPPALLNFTFDFLLLACADNDDGRVGVYLVRTNALEVVLEVLVQPLQTNAHPQTRYQRHASTVILASLTRVKAIAARLAFRDDVLRHVALVLQTNRMDEVDHGLLPHEMQLHLQSTAAAMRALLRCLRVQMQPHLGPSLLVAAQVSIAQTLLKIHAIEDVVAYIRPPNLVCDCVAADTDAVKSALQLVGLVWISAARRGANARDAPSALHTAHRRVISESIIKRGSRRPCRAATAVLRTLASDEPLPRVLKWCCKTLSQLACTNASASLLLSYRCMDVASTLVPNVPSSLPDASGVRTTNVTATSVHDEKLLALPSTFYTLVATLCRVPEGRAAVAKLNMLPRILKRLHLQSESTKQDEWCRTELMRLVHAMAHTNAIGLGNVNELFLRHHVHSVAIVMLESTPSFVSTAVMHEQAMGALGALALDHMRCIPPLLSVGVLKHCAALLTTYRDHEPSCSLPALESALQIVLGIALVPSDTVQAALANANVQDDLLRIGCSFHLEMQKAKITSRGAKSLGEMARETLRHMGDYAKKTQAYEQRLKQSLGQESPPRRSPSKQSPQHAMSPEGRSVSLPALLDMNHTSRSPLELPHPVRNNPSRPTSPLQASNAVPSLVPSSDLRHTRPPGPCPTPDKPTATTDKPVVKKSDEPYRFSRPKAAEARKYPFLLLDPLFGAVDMGVDPSVPGLALRKATSLPKARQLPPHASAVLGHCVELRASPEAKQVRLEARILSAKHKPKH
ncbi:hypothetical protein SDRG_03458 [Saprolegnia diclina VS20]|uniref:Uncharacterized protein n=1 Tax=Saprolegnia diclina (strain VS20) TaxID=1156394 RepID=T0S2N4_SAPDV|nr:hypothetical protein SDRG_03458 [Saprolegnia diclina VS20]EQC39253.1 hypothetical protein SDRG_03458 [Saprolegnia diclina VS20]|eukprot:XP_008607314.1 hypothetical protein SDRG_03458 [Saprolegnia diclina VS20]